MTIWKFHCLVIAMLLAGCADATATIDVPTLTRRPQFSPEIPITTLPGVSPSALPALPTSKETATTTTGPTQTKSPAVPLPTLSFPTLTVTDVPQPAPLSGVIQFYKPGPMSQVTSPVKVYGYAVPGYNHKGLIELHGEDGSLINSEILQLNTDYKWAFFSWSLNFTARGAGELGRLSLSTRDEFGRLTALRSMRLFLMKEGPEVITPGEAMVERVVLDNPPVGKRITGGHLNVSGDMQAYNEEPLIVELITIDGAVIGSQLIPIPPGKGGDYFAFRIDIPYSVVGSTPVLLTIHQPDDVIPGIIYLYSQAIVLSP
jgi:hypothetical protein